MKADVNLETGKRPITFLTRNINNNVKVRLKNDIEYRGLLSQCDSYMNLIMRDATEYHSNEPVAEYGNIFIRGNNVIFISFES
jgi:small nuclear ribonucleoprotein (snRNP)-like protein